MKSFNQFINESQDKKPVSRKYLEGLLLNTHNTTAKNFLKSMLSKKKDEPMIEFSERQYNLLEKIKKDGKLDPSQFHSKN